VNIENDVHITSSTPTYGVPVNAVITATGSNVKVTAPGGPWPDGLTFTDNGSGTMKITGTPVASGKSSHICSSVRPGVSPDHNR
jgi:hypothetical protein